MFEKIRKPGRAKGIFAWIIFGFIGFIFIFIGNPPDMGLTGNGPAAMVNSKPIPLNDFVQQLELLERRMGFDLNQIPADKRKQFSQEMRSRAIETLISRELIAQSAFKSGYVVSDEQLRDVIQNYTYFQEEGRFMRERYDNYLRAVGKTAQSFEEQMRRDIAIQTMQGLLSTGLIPVKAEMELFKNLKALQFNVEVATFDKEQIQNGIQVSASRAKGFLKEEQNLKVAESYYKGNLKDYSKEEEVRARHILISAPRDDAKAVAGAKEKINKIVEELKTGDFAKLAEKYSDDKASALKGGDLGFFGRGRMVPEFETAAFSGTVGEVSAPVQSQFGFHLIKVEEKKAAEVTPFEKVQVAIAQKLLAQNEVDAKFDEIKKLTEQADGTRLRNELKKLKIEWAESGEFDLASDYIPVLGKSEKLISAALSLKGPGQLYPQVLELDGRNYILRLKSKGEKKLAEDQTEIELQSLSRSGEIFNQWIRKQRETAKIEKNNSAIQGI